MQFKAGDVIVHPVHGVGHIATIEEKLFSQEKARLYYHITFSNSNMWVPINTQGAVGLRSVTAKKHLDKYRELLKSPAIPLNKNQPQQRHLALINRLKQGSFKIMCEVVRDLTASSLQKPLGVMTKDVLRKTQGRLYQEWATAADISVTEATEEINALLQTAQEATLK